MDQRDHNPKYQRICLPLTASTGHAPASLKLCLNRGMNPQLAAAFPSFALHHSSLSGFPQSQPNRSSGMQSNLKMLLYIQRSNCIKVTPHHHKHHLCVPGESHSQSRNTNTCFYSSDQHGASAAREKLRRVSMSSCCHHKTTSPAVHMATKQSPSHTTPSALTNFFCR